MPPHMKRVATLPCEMSGSFLTDSVFTVLLRQHVYALH